MRQDRPLLGTGNRGNIYRLDSDAMSTLLHRCLAHAGDWIRKRPQRRAVRSNGKHRPRLPHRSSDRKSRAPLRARCWTPASFTYWGRIGYRGSGGISVLTRSGNLNRPESNWSALGGAATGCSRRHHAVRIMRRRARHFPSRAIPAIQDRAERVGQQTGLRSFRNRDCVSFEERGARCG